LKDAVEKNSPERWSIPFRIIQSVWAIVSTPMVLKKEAAFPANLQKKHSGLFSMQNYD